MGPLLHNNIYIDENMDIFIHEHSLSVFIAHTYPEASHAKSDIAFALKNIFLNESRFVTINGNKFYHEKFVKKVLNIKI